jgi:DNA-directed RNA polymerase specialized sigma24 family protein
MAGLRYDEIGLHLNMSPVAVQAHLAEALALLNRSLAGIADT